jgi:hypothetical protein
MQSSHAIPSASPARRFLLLPEDLPEAGSRRPRIRRYQLAAVSTRRRQPAARVAGAHARAGEAPGNH